MADRHDDMRSLAEMNRSVPVPLKASNLRRWFAFAGPAYLVSVGYMDPGNWATDLAGGAKFGYQLVWVLVMSNLMAVLLQTLSARLGVVTGRDLAQACRDWYPAVLRWPLWLLCEIAIVACDLAEVLGAAIGLHLLFGIPLLWGVLITAGDVLLLLALSRLGMRRLEAIIVVLVATIGGCFAIEMFLSRPDIPAVLLNFLPRDAAGRPTLVTHDPGLGLSVLGLRHDSLYIAMGILGATVMPHNLYLHSSLVQTRAVEHSIEGKRSAVRWNLIDSVIALNAAFFVNTAILVLAAAAFHNSGHQDVAKLEDAHRLLTPLLGTSLAATLFAVALLSSGQASTITGTLAGQIVMEGFMRIRIQPWLRRLISRGLAIIPAVMFIAWRGSGSIDALLVLSQVVLSLQLSFAVIPLISFTSDRSKMGEFVNPPWVIVLAIVAAALILGLNIMLVAQQLAAWTGELGKGAPLMWVGLSPVLAVLGGTLAYILLAPFVGRRREPGAAASPSLAAGPVSAGSGRGVWTFGGRARARSGAASGAPPLLSPEALMAGDFRRIAVALEMGGGDTSVIELLEAMPPRTDTEVILMHVVESAAGRYLGPESSDLETRTESGTLESFGVRLRDHGFSVRVVLGHGDAATELARITSEAHADLLVAGSHGHGPISDLLFGATTSRLRHRVRCPMLIVPAAQQG